MHVSFSHVSSAHIWLYQFTVKEKKKTNPHPVDQYRSDVQQPVSLAWLLILIHLNGIAVISGFGFWGDVNPCGSLV